MVSLNKIVVEDWEFKTERDYDYGTTVRINDDKVIQGDHITADILKEVLEYLKVDFELEHKSNYDMKSYEELSSEAQYHEKEHSRLLNEIFHHPDFIKHYFRKLNLDENDNYIWNLISKLNIVHSRGSCFCYTMEGKHYLMHHQIVEVYCGGVSFYYDGTEEVSDDESDYKEDRKQAKRINNELKRVIGMYFKHKKEPNLLNGMLEKLNLNESIKVGFMLVLTKLIREKKSQ